MITSTADVETAVQVLTRAFVDDPMARWLLPGDLYAAAAPSVFGEIARTSAEHGELAVTGDGTAAAVWLPRPADAHPAEEEPFLPRLGTFLELTADRHPGGEAHLHLVFLGVVPAARGRGHGGALLRRRLERADTEGLPAYLEASSARSRALYTRHGFRDVGDPIRLPDGPVIWAMQRPTQP
jgi:GNAT superfamily N-acetyltransferase